MVWQSPFLSPGHHTGERRVATDFSATRAMFDLPEGVIYLDGNSLGPLPKAVPERLAKVVREEWGQMLIRGWNEAGWMEMPRRIGDRVARLIGAEPGSVVMGDTLSIKVWQALSSALELVPGRRVILSDTGNFPSDLYIADGLTRSLGKGYEVKTVAPEEVAAAIDESVAVVMVTETDYRSGRRHDMAALAQLAHARGALLVWDLAHSAGAFPVHLARDGADFAVGCSYKYLNSGPGGPAFIYVAPRHQAKARPGLSGWMGHEKPFAFDLDYRPGQGIERMRVGTPPILALAALDAALDVWEGVDPEDLRKASLALQEQFIRDTEAACPELELASPRDPGIRGSQVSFRHPEGYAIMQALIAQGVIGDFRAPDILRFGFTPLYIDESDIRRATAILARVMAERLWDNPAYKTRAAVT
ncbi:kynureninase [Pseudogemmobacter faecipullorum]|uniref:Kynureninase n=1 Tax=Pseudogemmobacter faecipullorum TaxID=2755041 RepID=A0ABS8CIS0_9RHOB|nr:kynureninase [Pseudogemmobacter faecipullorum]MCB5409276.1 kynureninase [Pseudogemmobacter faecipullorum]